MTEDPDHSSSPFLSRKTGLTSKIIAAGEKQVVVTTAIGREMVGFI